MCDDFRYPYCPKCGDSFPMRKGTYQGLEECGNTFYCSLGHALIITRKSIVLQLRTTERRVEYKLEQVSRLLKRAESYRGVQTRQRNRLLRGDCPYCGIEPYLCDIIEHIKEKHGPKKGSA